MIRVWLAAWIALIGSATVHAQTEAPASRLAVSSGTVEVQRGNVWSPIGAGEQLNPGESVRTSNGSSAAVDLGPGKVITLTERTQIQVRPANGTSAVQLDSGSIKIFANSDLQIAAKDTILETAERPLDMELGYEADRLNLTVFSGAVRNGPIIVRGNQDANASYSRTYTAGSHRPDNAPVPAVYPDLYIYPYFMYGNRAAQSGPILPHVPVKK